MRAKLLDVQDVPRRSFGDDWLRDGGFFPLLQVLVIAVLYRNDHLFADAIDCLRRRITRSVWDAAKLDVHGHSVAWIT